MEVNLLSYTPDALEIIYTAFRTCYAKLKPEQIWQEIKENKISREEIIKFIKNGLATGHESPLEHVSFTFVISGVSRALSHQLVRHRLASYSQQSQRYVQFKPGETDYVTPPTWHQAGLVDDLDELVRLTCQLYEKAISRGVPAEDARFVFLNAFCTNLTMTMNYRQLLHTADLRLCYQAQWEIRNLFVLIRQRVSEVYPELGRAISPQCGKGRLGYCPERLEKYKKCPLRTGCLHKRFYHKGFIIKVLS